MQTDGQQRQYFWFWEVEPKRRIFMFLLWFDKRLRIFGVLRNSMVERLRMVLNLCLVPWNPYKFFQSKLPQADIFHMLCGKGIREDGRITCGEKITRSLK